MFYNFVINPIVLLYKWLYLSLFGLTGSYGISLLLMSVITFLVTSPFMRWAGRIQKNEKHIQDILKPQIETIKSQSQGAEQHRRIANLYKSYAYHPAMAVRSVAGLAVQIPFLIAAYYMLSELPDIKGQSFLIIKDLSKPDGLIGPVNILPILMTAINLMSACTTAAFARKDKIQAAIISFLFLLLLYNAPSALLIFWTCNNLWGLLGNVGAPFAGKIGLAGIKLTIRGKTIPERLAGVNYEIYVILALTTTFCLFIPIDIYIRNSSEFWFSLGDIIWMLLACCLISTAILAVITYFIKGRNRIFFICLLIGLALGFFLQSYIINIDYGVLDGRQIDWNSYRKQGIINALFWTLCMAIPFVILKIMKKDLTFKKIFSRLSCLLIFIQICSIVFLFSTTPVLNKNEAYLSTDKMFEVSENENIIIIILDTFDTEIFQRIIKNNPQFKQQLEGFTFYPDTVGSFPDTMTAIPQILTNYWYSNKEPFNDYLNKAWTNNPFWELLKNRKYDIRILTDSKLVVKNNYIANFVYNKTNINSYSALIKDLYLLTAFRSMPNISKKYFWIYSGDFNKYMASKNNNNYVMDDVMFFKNLTTNSLQLKKGENSFRFYHLKGAHLPITMNKEIKRVQTNSVNIDDQAVGAMKIVFKYLEILKELGVYDKTIIFIAADHGFQNKVTASPLMLVKGLHQNKSMMQTSDNPISYVDIHATIVSLLKLDPSTFGTPFSEKKDIKSGRRHFVYFKDSNVKDYAMLPLKEYSVFKNVKNKSSWVETGNIYYFSKESNHKYILGENIYFSSTGNSFKYIGSGWSKQEATFRWSVGSEVNLFFNIKDIKKDFICLRLTCTPYLGKEMLYKKILVCANGENITEWLVSKASTYEASIPSEIVKNNNAKLNIKLYISNPISPKEIGESEDARKLGIAVTKIVIKDGQGDTNVAYQLGTSVSFTTNSNSTDFITNNLIAGWSHPEASHTWTEGKEAIWTFNVNNTKNKDLNLRLSAFPYLGGKLKQQIVNVFVNETKVAKWSVTKDDWYEAVIPADVNKDGKLMIKFTISDPTSPKEVGKSQDSRKLGIAVKELIISEAD